MAIPPSPFPLLLWIIALYLIVNLIVLGTLLTVRLAIATVQAFSELKRRREEQYEKFLLAPRSLPGRHNRTWRRQERWRHLSRRIPVRRMKGGKPWM